MPRVLVVEGTHTKGYSAGWVAGWTRIHYQCHCQCIPVGGKCWRVPLRSGWVTGVESESLDLGLEVYPPPSPWRGKMEKVTDTKHADCYWLYREFINTH